MKQGHKEYVKHMSATLHMGNLDQVLKGFHSIPKPYNDANGLEIKIWNLNGTITTPWFQSDYVEEYYIKNREFLLVLELPDDIKDQVGSGSLTIDLEVDTREVEGWVEEVSTFTFHTIRKNWSEAESHCQKEGGHLASVISEEVNQVLANVASGKYVWLGGRRKDGEWTWSDNSTWGHTNWESISGSRNCVRLYSGTWVNVACTNKYEFFCQTNKILKGKRMLSQTYSKNELNPSTMVVLYKYKAASQQLLDSWKDKRMTGIRFSWRIKNAPLIASISEVGRSIRTPHLGDAFEFPDDLVYRALLSPSKSIIEQMSNGSLVIELDITMNPSDEAYAFTTSYKLYKLKRSWTDADLHCRKEGGQLASIHSKWEQLKVEKAAEGERYVWLGGRKIDGQWQWADNTTWSFENWRYNAPRSYKYLQMEGVLWLDFYSVDRIPFLCQGPKVALTKSGLVRIEFNKEQLDFFPFHVVFKSKAFDQPTLNTSSAGDDETMRRNSGFTLNWFLKDNNGTQVTEKLPARQEDWKREVIPRYKDPFFHMMVQLAKELRLQNMTKKEILKEVIIRKSQTSVMTKADEMCLMGQINKEQNEVFSKVLSSLHKRDGEPIVEDIETGYELFHVVMFCSPMVFNTYSMIDQLLSFETTRAIILATVNLFQSGAITDETTFALTRQFYQVLADTLDMQYGNILLATMTSEQMQAAIRNKWPFFNKNTAFVEKCLQGSTCDTLQGLYQNLGKAILSFLPKVFHYRCQQRVKRAVPPPGPPDS